MKTTAVDENIAVYDIDEDSEVIKNIEEKVSAWYHWFNDNNIRYRQSYDFVMACLDGGSGQWNAAEVEAFEGRKKVFLTVNRLYADIQQILGEQRQNSPQPQITALTDQVEQKQVSLLEGLIRGIAYGSQSDIAYQTAFKNALCGGYGAIRILADYESEKSFNQELLIKQIEEPTLCYWDIAAQDKSKGDGQFCGLYSTISLQEFKEIAGDEEAVSELPPAESGAGFKWFDGKRVTIVEHFEKRRKKTKLYLLSNGESVYEEELEERMAELKKQSKMMNKLAKEVQGDPHFGQMAEQLAQKPIGIIDERETWRPEIWHYKITGKALVEKTLFDKKGKYLPIIFVDGDSYYKGGRQITRPYTLFAEDAQRLTNYVFSDMAQRLKSSHHGRVMGTIGQIPQQYLQYYQNPELPVAFLPWQPDKLAPGAPPPQYIPAPELPQSILQIPMLVENMTQTILGRYNVNKGGDSGEGSGRAIAMRTKQGNIGTFVYFDNLNRAIVDVGLATLSYIPNIYTTDRVVAIAEKDGSQKHINTDFSETFKDMDKFKLTVTIGSPYEMQQLDNANQLVMAMQSLAGNPLTPVMGDLVVENLQLPNTPQLVKRFKDNVVNPKIIAQEAGEQPPPTPPDPMLQIQQQRAQAEALKAQADMMEAQARMEKVKIDMGVSSTKAQAEVGKAQLEYAGKLVDHHTSAKQNALVLENQRLKHEVEQHKNIANMLLGSRGDVSQY